MYSESLKKCLSPSIKVAETVLRNPKPYFHLGSIADSELALLVNTSMAGSNVWCSNNSVPISKILLSLGSI